MDVYAAKHYRDFVNFCLKSKESSLARGAVTRLSDFIRTHPTHVSQVLTGKAEFSIEQAVGFCNFVGLDLDATEYFIDLLQRDRAGNKEAIRHFENRLKKRRKERTELRNRLKLKHEFTDSQKAYYFQDWIPQAVHMLTQLEAPLTPAQMAARLGVPLEQILETVERLIEMGVIENDGSRLRSLRQVAFIGDKEGLTRRLHTNWRLKTINEIQHYGCEDSVHFSALFTMDEETAKVLHDMIVSHLESIKEKVLPAPEKDLYCFCLDYYQLRSRSDT